LAEEGKNFVATGGAPIDSGLGVTEDSTYPHDAHFAQGARPKTTFPSARDLPLRPTVCFHQQESFLPREPSLTSLRRHDVVNTRLNATNSTPSDAVSTPRPQRMSLLLFEDELDASPPVLDRHRSPPAKPITLTHYDGDDQVKFPLED
jgi:hypothetical protein